MKAENYRTSTAAVAGLLFLSGFCSLAYQMVWLREFRLVFGSTTAASAAVLAVFMGGLGLGAALVGSVAPRQSNSLRFYGLLELSVAASASVTPALLWVVRALYLTTGGVVTLGPSLASILQVVLALAVLLLPCLLMGATLPIACRYVTTNHDTARASTGLLYGWNALGAFVGVGFATFWMLEHLGSRGTLWSAALLNFAIGLWATRRAAAESEKTQASKSRGAEPKPQSREKRRAARKTPGESDPSPASAPAGLVYAAAGLTGFVFFLIELVWYRMLAPLMGGSIYTVGLVLACALAGIGLGGVFFRTWVGRKQSQATLKDLALVLALQSLALILPYALGDRFALFALEANAWKSFGFPGQVLGWSAIAGCLTLLPSFCAGLQFPMLVSLLGKGGKDLTKQLGRAYAANTSGSILGSLLGGFVLIPKLTAPGCWQLSVLLTCVLAALCLTLSSSPRARRQTITTCALLVVTFALLLLAQGPSALWRHTPIGYGLTQALPTGDPELQDFVNSRRRGLVSEFEGRSASLGLRKSGSYTITVNGKADGSALGDAPTQVMAGLIAALEHPKPQAAFVLGLATGCTAGWLADLPGMSRVDVVDIEAAMYPLAAGPFAPVNRDVTRKDNVNFIVGDGREVLLTKGPSYDLIFSEPSNPYRAGIAALYTQEFYQSAARRLNPGGIFSQWVQAYDIDTATIRLVYATMASVFPHVETWMTVSGDLVFIGHQQAPDYSREALKARIALPIYREALARAWQTDTVEGFLSHHIADPAFARAVAAEFPAVNTDNTNVLEFGFARGPSGSGGFSVANLAQLAEIRDQHQPSHIEPRLGLGRMALERCLSLASENRKCEPREDIAPADRARINAIRAFVDRDYEEVLRRWVGPPQSLMARLILAEAQSHAGSAAAASALLESIAEDWSSEAHFLAARLALREAQTDKAAVEAEAGILALYAQPWNRTRPSLDGLALIRALTKSKPALAGRYFTLLEQPFPVAAFDEERLKLRLALSLTLDAEAQVEAADAFGEHVPWNEAFLAFRLAAYQAAGDARLASARRDLDAFRRQAKAATP